MSINVLRELIRTGEYLETNIGDNNVRNKWIFDVEDYVEGLGSNYIQRAFNAISMLKNYSSSIKKDLDRVRLENLELIMGLLRSLYNRNTTENKPFISNEQAVFIVHGHDDRLIEDVKNVITQMGFKPIVLREQPNNGKTIIEKLEDWLGNTKCAVILYTPCDVGKANNELSYEQRARQNVVYEHGLFQGYLGRKRIIVLKKDNTVIPGDCMGVVYTSVDNTGWQNELEKNILAIDK